MTLLTETLRAGKETLTTQSSKVAELELRCKKATEKEEKLQDKIKVLEGKISKHDNVVIRSGSNYSFEVSINLCLIADKTNGSI